MIKIFEAFAGYGTATFALKQLGIEHELVGFSEIDKYAIQCFQQNHGGKNYGDITKINWASVPDFDLLTGGFPCQSFSVAGKGLGHLDERGVLANYLTKALLIKKPKYFMFENVKGFMSKKHQEFRETLFNDWKNAGYTISYQVLNTREHGIPQNRERVFIIGIRKDLEQDFVFPEKEELKLKLKDLLEDNVDEKYFLKPEQVEKIMAKGSMRNRMMQKKDVSGTLLSRDYKDPKCIELTKGVSDAQRIYSEEGCAKTLKGLGGGQGAKTGLYLLNNATKRGFAIAEDFDGIRLQQPQSKTARGRVQKQKSQTLQTSSQIGVIYNNLVRRLTPKECFRLQGFLKDEVNLDGLSDTQKYKLAGNGQSVNVVKLIFKELLKESGGVKNKMDLIEIQKKAFEKGRKQGALEEVKLLEVFNSKSFINKSYVLLRKYCEERIKELEGKKVKKNE